MDYTTLRQSGDNIIDAINAFQMEMLGTCDFCDNHASHIIDGERYCSECATLCEAEDIYVPTDETFCCAHCGKNKQYAYLGNNETSTETVCEDCINEYIEELQAEHSSLTASERN